MGLKRGGTAGGGKGPQINAIKPGMPKFIQQFKLRATGMNEDEIYQEMKRKQEEDEQENEEDFNPYLKQKSVLDKAKKNTDIEDLDEANIIYENFDSQENLENKEIKRKDHINTNNKNTDKQQQKQTSKIGNVEHIDMKKFKPVFKSKNNQNQDEKKSRDQEIEKIEKKNTKSKKQKVNTLSFADDYDEEEE
ncbi:hypothetical protein PPERSA_05005 [Pseudocohnilembus persalinus]|uniref:DUF4604 domain-containing protein n=1 Tax=Pseudocohnilembus persalinus TaxID=266149 RepID=A0A0V0QWT0_PSEPJ|nr:hypothetical protein PPERSA_05005 [Pseudocohnilembus persalinus]|eukprot:KRX06392.1 hypothetical protein PPERSA_05005 [Pseudocohnilembus persalinus]